MAVNLNQKSEVSTAGKAAEPVIIALEQFEYMVTRDDMEKSTYQLLCLLQALDTHFGQWSSAFSACVSGVRTENIDHHICTRLAGAITVLFSRPGFNVSDEGFMQLMRYHRWLALVFAVSGYGHADHIIRNINVAGGQINQLTLNMDNFRLFCLCYYPESLIVLEPDVLWQFDRERAVCLFFSLLSGRVLPAEQGHAKRELLLAWLPEKLLELDSLSFLPTAVLHDVYMHCSYADFPGKHQIKHSINVLTRKTLLSNGYKDLYPYSVAKNRKKPVMLVVLEWFNSEHSVYRTHSAGFRALRRHFTTHALALESAVDENSEGVFDVCHKIKSASSQVDDALELVSTLQPDVVYYAGIGMFPYTVYLSNLRLAPVQIAGLGHAASTFSEYIDYFVVEDDFVGDESCFRESVIRVSSDALPFVRPREVTELKNETVNDDEPLRIAVCASIMKINPGFLSTLETISQRSARPVVFCFYLGFGFGLTFSYLESVIKAVLPGAEVNMHMPVQQYLSSLGNNALFVSPFPYGNMNGIADCVSLGLPGVCLTGPEVHAHIDEGLFHRAGLPATLIARTKEEYINAVISLVTDDAWRASLQEHLHKKETQERLWTGKPEKFARRIYTLYKSHRS